MRGVPLVLVLLSAAVAAAAETHYERPFRADSPWNCPIPPGAQYERAPGLDATPIGLSTWLAPDHVSVPVARATDKDPEVAVLHNPRTWEGVRSGRWRGVRNPPPIEREILAGSGSRFPYAFHPYVSRSAYSHVLPETYRRIDRRRDAPLFIRVPKGARPTGNADGHFVVFQPDGRAFESFGTIVLADGSVVALSYNLTDPASAGDGIENGVTASMIPVYAGLLRQRDLDSGRIDHALKVVVPAALLHTSFVYPATSFDRGALREAPPYSGGLPMGARLALPPGADPRALGLETALGQAIAAAAATFGMIVVDRGGEGVTIVAEGDLSGDVKWSEAGQRDLQAIARALSWVRAPVAAPGEPCSRSLPTAPQGQ